MSIREASLAELDAIMGLETASFPTDAWSRATMEQELASAHTRYFVAEDNGELQGYAGVRALQGSRDADVQTIAVAKDARGNGLGRRLLHTLFAAAQDVGASELFLDVRADNVPATALYVSEGFVEIGRRPRYYQPDDVDAVVMKLDFSRSGTKGQQ